MFISFALVDDRPEEYPPELLRRWKEEAEQGPGVDPPVSEAEIEEILSAMVVQEITLSAESIHLGGTLGGGGGASASEHSVAAAVISAYFTN